MSRARRRRPFATFVVAAATGLLGAGVTVPAVAADADTLYVIKGAAKCSDAGPGTMAQPFCTVQAGVDAAGPGQRVLVSGSEYLEQVTVRRSGEPGKPIVIEGMSGVLPKPDIGVYQSQATSADSHGFVLDRVHDVTVRGFTASYTAEEAFLVRDSSNITLDSNTIAGAGRGVGAQPNTSAATPAVRLTGASHGVVVSRNLVGGGNAGGIVVDAGVSGAVVTTNALTANWSTGIRVTDAPGTVVVSNTVVGGTADGIALTGASDHAVVENNVVALNHRSDSEPYLAEIAVSAASAPGTKADYNTVDPELGGTAYSWAGQAYQQPAELTATTAQGAHDLREMLGFGVISGCMNCSVAPQEATGSTDSADTAAPGELATDLYGRQRIDAPVSANSGPDGGYYDRGAVELQEYGPVRLAVSQGKGPNPLPVTASASVEWQSWSDPATTFTFDFGDGTEPLVTKDTKVQHVYRTNGVYRPTVTVHGGTEHAEMTDTSHSRVEVVDPADLAVDLRIAPQSRGDLGGPLGFSFDLSHSTSSWYFRSTQLDFGDGTPVQTAYTAPNVSKHSYARPGDYTVTATLTDQGGRTATVKQVVHAAYNKLGFTPITPTRVLDTRQPGELGVQRVGPGQTRTVSVPAQPGHPHADAAVLNVTAVNPSQAGYLTVYPLGPGRPATSNVNFTAGQTVPNLVTVPVGDQDKIVIDNFAGTTDVVVDVMGYYQADAGSRFDAVAPSRLLDTRKSAAVGPDASTSIQVRGAAGVPADATAVVLNLTSTGSDAGGYLTAYASGTARPGTSNLNFTAGQTVANQVVVPIGADGKVSVYNRFGHTQVVADVFGYYSPTASSLFTPVVPTRLVDTRKQSALGAGQFLKVDTGAPAGATGAVLNVTSTASTAGGYLTVWADGATKPGTSNVNFPAGGTVPNHVTTPLGTNGAFDVYNFAGSTQVVADLFGYFSK
ncbi:right-handed parallel beta-helix repeat-containing protein [Kitasatospora sp. NPDC002227]|uniref:right-handed parallel beta-helix repeat-containing protein n=1 Tax=Kitasatospora sp. NPDC002227 TaxID=3154773 RepID=UPI003333C08F